jgi:hypothetical protein
VSDLPQSLYAPSAKDRAAMFVASQRLDNVTASAAAAAVEAVSNGPTADQVLLLRHVLGILQAGAAQSVTSAILAIQSFDGDELVQLKRAVLNAGSWSDGRAAVAAPTELVISWTGEIELLEGQRLALTGGFSAGAAANFSVIKVVGILIPRGGWQRA